MDTVKAYSTPFLALFIFILGLSLESNALSQNKTETEVKPVTLYKPEFECTRTYIYKNKAYPIDSSRKQDGEGLRMVLKNNSKSEELLNSYQGKSTSLLIPAYLGSLGVATTISGILYANAITSELGRSDTRKIFLSTGISLIIGSYFYGRYALGSKENTLEKAIQTYNDEAPKEEKIQFNLVPVFQGTGGEVKTIVPF